MLNHWTTTNREFQERISETQDTQARLSSHMHLVDKVRTEKIIDNAKTTF